MDVLLTKESKKRVRKQDKGRLEDPGPSSQYGVAISVEKELIAKLALDGLAKNKYGLVASWTKAFLTVPTAFTIMCCAFKMQAF